MFRTPSRGARIVTLALEDAALADAARCVSLIRKTQLPLDVACVARRHTTVDWADLTIPWPSELDEAHSPQEAPRIRRAVEQFVSALAVRKIDVAIIVTAENESPYVAALVCFLAGIPRRVGSSREFGGALLTSVISPASGSSRAQRLTEAAVLAIESHGGA